MICSPLPIPPPVQSKKVYEIVVHRGDTYIGTYQSNQQPTITQSGVLTFTESGTEEQFTFINHVVSIRCKNASVGETHRTFPCLQPGE